MASEDVQVGLVLVLVLVEMVLTWVFLRYRKSALDVSLPRKFGRTAPVPALLIGAVMLKHGFSLQVLGFSLSLVVFWALIVLAAHRFLRRGAERQTG